MAKQERGEVGVENLGRGEGDERRDLVIRELQESYFGGGVGKRFDSPDPSVGSGRKRDRSSGVPAKHRTQRCGDAVIGI